MRKLMMLGMLVVVMPACITAMSEADWLKATGELDTGQPSGHDSNENGESGLIDSADTESNADSGQDSSVVIDSGDTDTAPVDPLATDDDGDRYSENDGDCNDADAAVSPEAIEVCNGVDDDCDGAIDADDSYVDDSSKSYFCADNDADSYYNESLDDCLGCDSSRCKTDKYAAWALGPLGGTLGCDQATADQIDADDNDPLVH